ncbi:hypothetical protein Bca52824_066794 [Brassica carinata]|uniref:Uncharacterized protein n=1 Tax=Brassica carinata TaxID=52824 RepID=A0A8X7QKU7_BRACI|nr:hypothetical protein Bca52824_066794 [Brassica carinata]
MLRLVADSSHGIPRRCMCGGRFINEVGGKEDYDTLPGKRFFMCKNYEEELERLTKRVEEAAGDDGVSNLTKQIETLEEQVKILNEQVYDLLCAVDTLEKVQPIDNQSGELIVYFDLMSMSSPPIGVDSAEPGVNSRVRVVGHGVAESGGKVLQSTDVLCLT